MSASQASFRAVPSRCSNNRWLSALWRKWSSRRQAFDSATASVCESLERRVLMAGLHWSWNTNPSDVDTSPSWGSPVYTQMPDPSNPSTPPPYNTVDAVDVNGYKDGYLQSSNGGTETLTLSGTNLASISNGYNSIGATVYAMDFDLDNNQSAGDWKIDIKSTGADGSQVETVETGKLQGPGYPVSIDANREYNLSVGGCYVSAGNAAYGIHASFPNYSSSNSVTITFQVSDMTQAATQAGYQAPPTVKWGLDNVAVSGSDCGCSGPQKQSGGVSSNVPGIGSSADGSGLSGDTGWSSDGSAFGDGGTTGNSTTSGMASTMLQDGGRTLILVSGGATRFFDDLTGSGTFVARDGSVEQVSHASNYLTLSSPDGTRRVYYDYGSAWTPSLQGKLYQVVAPAGSSSITTTSYAYDASNSYRLAAVERDTTDVSGTARSEQFVYSYVASGANVGKVDDVLLQRSIGGGSYSGWRETKYQYYDGTSGTSSAAALAYGNAGDLMSVQTLDATTGTLPVIDTTYMRYYTPTGAGTNGYSGALEYVVRPASFARMAAAGYNPLTTGIADSVIGNYADEAYQYNTSTHVVRQEVVQGEGPSGFGTHSFSYGYNNSTNTVTLGDGHGASWSSRVNETLPDGTIDRTYYDGLGNTLLDITIDASGNQWGTYYLRDSQGRVLETFNSSALSLPSQSTLESYPDLLNFQNGRSPYVKTNSGLVQFNDYFGDSSGSDAAGYIKDTGVTRGELATPVVVSGIATTTTSTVFTVTTATASGYSNGDSVLIAGSQVSDFNGAFTISSVTSTTFQITVPSAPTNTAIGSAVTANEPQAKVVTESWTYDHHANSAGALVVQTSGDTLYANGDGTGGRTTSYSFTWNGDQVRQETVTAPVISSAQNGSSSSVSTETFNDTYGRPIFTMDGDGHVNYTEYDPATGAVIESVVDVNYASLTASQKTLYNATTWSTNVGGLNLATYYQVDGDGRTTRMTDPNGNVAFIVYDDVNHSTRAYQGYMSGSGTSVTFVEVGPTIVQREDRAGSYMETISIVTAPHLTSGIPDGSEAIASADIRSLARTHTNAGSQVDETDRYLTFGTGTNVATYTTGAGSFQLKVGSTTNVASADFYATTYGYDAAGRQNRVVNPVGTITRTVYDALGRVASTWMGTNDTPSSGVWSPTNAAGMTKIQDNYYDTYDPSSVGIGDGNLTRIVNYASGTTSIQVTDNFYDWRDRLVATKSGVLLDSNNRYAATSSESGSGMHRPIVYNVYNNLGEVVETDQFDGDAQSPSNSAGVSIETNPTDTAIAGPPSSSALRAMAKMFYDDQGRVFRSSVFKVDQSSGATSSTSLDGNAWYDNRGNVMASQPAGGATRKYVYDGAGRLIKQYTTDGGQTNSGAGTVQSWSNASNVAGDIVLSQVATQYDGNGNITLVTKRDRYHNDATNSAGSGLGDLQDPSNNPKARVSFQSFYYDQANRQTASVDWGTLGGTNNAGGVNVISLTAVPPRSGTALVTSFTYDDAGRQDSVTDPRGIASKSYFDMLGRPARTLAAWDGTNQSPANASTPSIGAASNQAIDYSYDGDDHVILQTAWNKMGTNAATFQSTAYIYGVTTGGGSGLNSNDILLKVEYPNSSTGNPGTTSAYIENYAYDALGEMTKKTQRTGSVHSYTHDALGRMTVDNVTTLGSGVSGSIRQLDYAFDTGGRLYTATSRSGTSSTSGIVNQVERLYNGFGQLTQEYQSSSGAVVTTGTNATPGVGYTYSEMSDGSGGYANHSLLTGIVYPTGSRTVNYAYTGNSGLDNVISRLSALTQTLSGTTTTLESYDYLGTDTIVAAHHPQTGVDLTYEQQSGDSKAINDGGDAYTGLDRFGRVDDQNYLNTNSGTNFTSTDRFQYGYDADSNSMYKKNLVSSANSELYHSNGTSGVGTSYDALNRLTNFQRGTLASGNASISGSASATRNWTLDAQGNWSADASGNAYTVNQQNQYTTVAGSYGSGCCCGGGGTIAFAYDNDGNLTSRPAAGTGATANDTFTYDAWNRLASYKRTFDGSNGDVQQSDYDVDALGRRLAVTSTGEGYVGDQHPLPSDRLYYSVAWQVLEDDQTVNTFNTGGTVTGSTYSQMQFVWSPTYVNDLVLRDRSTSGNGTFNERVYVQHDLGHNVTAITNVSGSALQRWYYDPYGVATCLSSGWATTTDAYNFNYLYQGGRLDTVTGLYTFQRREYDPSLGRWTEQDPAGYLDGASLYRSVGGNPIAHVDPTGLWKQDNASKGKSRATWISQEGDTLADLAQKVSLSSDVKEMNHWLKGGSICFKWFPKEPGTPGKLKQLQLSEEMCPGQKVTVPNVWIAANLLQGGGLVQQTFVNPGGDIGRFIGTDLNSSLNGKKVIKVKTFGALADAVDENIGDIWGMEIYGHGNRSGYLGVHDSAGRVEWQEWGNQEIIIHSLRSQGFRLAVLKAMQCFSFAGHFQGDWNDVALSATGYEGENVLGIDTK